MSVHVVFRGRNDDLELQDIFPEHRLDSIGVERGSEVTPQSVSEQQVKTALSLHYDVPNSEFTDHYVEINPNGNITVRPNATFG